MVDFFTPLPCLVPWVGGVDGAAIYVAAGQVSAAFLALLVAGVAGGAQ